jgi:hypothetical protein
MDKLVKSLREAEWELFLMYRSGNIDRIRERELWWDVTMLDGMIAARDG